MINFFQRLHFVTSHCRDSHSKQHTNTHTHALLGWPGILRRQLLHLQINWLPAGFYPGLKKRWPFASGLSLRPRGEASACTFTWPERHWKTINEVRRDHRPRFHNARRSPSWKIGVSENCFRLRGATQRWENVLYGFRLGAMRMRLRHIRSLWP